jgi:hypothetical protein
MSTRITFAVCATILLCSTGLQAQYVPAGALPTYYNGGFAGEAGAFRVASFSYLDYNYYLMFSGRTSWTRSGSFISVDNFFKKIRSGVALTVNHQGRDRQFTNTAMSLVISPKFSFKGKYTFAPFADFSFGRYNYRNLPGYLTYYPESYHINSYGIKTGFLVNSENAYIGISANIFHYSTTSPALRNYVSAFTNMTYVLQTGYTFQRTPESRFSFTPQLVVSYERLNIPSSIRGIEKKLHNITLLDLSLMFRYKKFIYGTNSRGLMLMLGYQNNRFKLLVNGGINGSFIGNKVNGYHFNNNFRITIPGEGLSGYSGSISLRYTLRKKPSVKAPGF